MAHSSLEGEKAQHRSMCVCFIVVIQPQGSLRTSSHFAAQPMLSSIANRLRITIDHVPQLCCAVIRSREQVTPTAAECTSPDSLCVPLELTEAKVPLQSPQPQSPASPKLSWSIVVSSSGQLTCREMLRQQCLRGGAQHMHTQICGDPGITRIRAQRATRTKIPAM